MATISEVQAAISSKFDETVFMKILQMKARSENVKVNRINLGASTQKGNSYLSTVTRFTVEATNGNNEKFKLYVIVKAYPKNIARRKTFRTADFFMKEVCFYEKVWPLLIEFQNSKEHKEKFCDIPVLLASYADQTDGFIAMEDLSYESYKMLPRNICLDLQHTQLILQTFAKLHALSYAHKLQQAKEFEEICSGLEETYFDEKFRNWYENFQRNTMRIVKDAVEKQLDKMYFEKIDNIFEQDFLSLVIESVNQKDNPLCVLTHGDAWIPNFLVKYKDETPISIKLIDFQLSRCSSLSLDLLFFFYSCIDQHMREAHFNKLLTFYRDCFVSFAQELGCKEASWVTTDIIKEDMKKFGVYGLAMSMESIVMSVLDDRDVCDMDNIKGDEALPLETVWTVDLIQDEQKRQRLADFVKHMIDSKFI